MAMHLVPIYALVLESLLLHGHLRPYHGGAILLVLSDVAVRAQALPRIAVHLLAQEPH
jgi:hypothetical protein